VLAEEAGQALHVLDRFHITMHMNKGVDEVRRSKSSRLRAHSQQQAMLLSLLYVFNA
jgi:transposase